MQHIHALEASPRGAYTGSIGSLFDDGSAHLNVAIRTATIRDGLAHFRVGAGIVADSDPGQEWLETLAKGQMLHRWLGAAL
jgi:anthranilate/para-aminobenzoate synthase component I